MALHRIMVVDDNLDMLFVYSRILKSEGYEVFSAASGADCLEQVAKVHPDIFLMDVMLPDWNGIDLVKELKGRPEFSHSIFVLLSGVMVDSDSRLKGLDAGALDYLSRPIPNQELIAKLRSIIKVTEFQDSLVLLSQELDQRVKDRTRELEATIEILRGSEDKHRNILLTAMDGFWVVDSGGQLLEVNETYCKMSGYSTEELLAMRISDLDALETPGQAAAHLQRVIEFGEDRFESRHRRKDGSVFEIEISVQYRPIDGGRFVAFLRDITERKRSEEENAKLEAQFLQAQKMESVGRLAGGVAHDFNNMLNVILGHTELVLERADPADSFYSNLEEIRIAAERSADLTRQLLALARKQTVDPKILDLNQTVQNLLNMLKRLIGEDIRISWHPQANLWPIKMDPSQVVQILINLCVNARDAIANIGSIIIETGNCLFEQDYSLSHPGFVHGEYVRLAVSDDGCGMDKDTQAHLFEPFFTTKGVGKGVGLGLSTVYGIVKQNQGFIHVSSERGKGTMFKIYIPRHQGNANSAQMDRTIEQRTQGSETILVVDDERSILRMATMALERLGYTVMVAHSPAEAIRAAKNHPEEIHLLITDIIMPEMNGQDLANKMISMHPGLKCLFMSGYAADVLSPQSAQGEKAHCLQKPFSIKDLAIMVRVSLDN